MSIFLSRYLTDTYFCVLKKFMSHNIYSVHQIIIMGCMSVCVCVLKILILIFYVSLICLIQFYHHITFCVAQILTVNFVDDNKKMIIFKGIEDGFFSHCL